MRRRLLLTPLLAGTLAACGGGDCPPVEALRTYRPPEASRVYAGDGSLVAHLSPQRRVVVDLDRFPAVLQAGVVAVEDRRFWRHGGIDFRGMVRATWRGLRRLELREGFSTLTMQLPRNIWEEDLPRRDRFRRKLCELRMAPRIERTFTKQQILELYLNQMYLGDGLYGMEAGAEGYFGKSASELTVAETAMLIALLKNPQGYNPRRHTDLAIRRRNIVLRVMARERVIAAAEAERAMEQPLRLAPPAEAAGPAPYFIAAVRRELRERFGPDADIRGLRVHTALEPALQQAATVALREQLARIEGGSHGRYRHPIYGRDSADAANGSPFLQGMVIALDPHTGDVRALVGGRDFRHSQYDRALVARRQPGSAFKPIVYAAALNAGLPLSSRIETSDVIIEEAGAGPWRPGDHVPDTVQSLSMRNALAISSNAAAVRVGRWAGEDRVIRMARSLGVTTPIPAFPSIHLGAAEVVPAELVAAYAAFGNGGQRVRARFVRRVEDARGQVLWRAPIVRERALDEGVAYLTLSLMEGVVDRGTGAAVRRVGFQGPAAGKTGTTNQGKDAWFVGLTPDVAAGVWIGFDQPRPIVAGAGGGGLAAPVWGDMMSRFYADRPLPPPWTAPASLTTAAIDETTGMLATGNCPPELVRVEYFIPGTQPLDGCPLHPESGAERLIDRFWRGLRNVF
jgi:membrane carboxypeptidase/penicillin-binding protein